MMEKMENIVFDRNYEEDEPDPLAQAIFDQLEESSKGIRLLGVTATQLENTSESIALHL